MTFHAQADSLESKAQLLSNALLQLDELPQAGPRRP